MARFNTATSTAWAFEHERENLTKYSEEDLATLLWVAFTKHVDEVRRHYNAGEYGNVIEYLFDPFDTFEI